MEDSKSQSVFGMTFSFNPSTPDHKGLKQLLQQDGVQSIVQKSLTITSGQLLDKEQAKKYQSLVSKQPPKFSDIQIKQFREKLNMLYYEILKDKNYHFIDLYRFQTIMSNWNLLDLKCLNNLIEVLLNAQSYQTDSPNKISLFAFLIFEYCSSLDPNFLQGKEQRSDQIITKLENFLKFIQNFKPQFQQSILFSSKLLKIAIEFLKYPVFVTRKAKVCSAIKGGVSIIGDLAVSVASFFSTGNIIPLVKLGIKSLVSLCKDLLQLFKKDTFKGIKGLNKIMRALTSTNLKQMTKIVNKVDPQLLLLTSFKILKSLEVTQNCDCRKIRLNAGNLYQIATNKIKSCGGLFQFLQQVDQCKSEKSKLSQVERTFFKDVFISSYLLNQQLQQYYKASTNVQGLQIRYPIDNSEQIQKFISILHKTDMYQGKFKIELPSGFGKSTFCSILSHFMNSNEENEYRNWKIFRNKSLDSLKIPTIVLNGKQNIQDNLSILAELIKIPLDKENYKSNIRHVIQIGNLLILIDQATDLFIQENDQNTKLFKSIIDKAKDHKSIKIVTLSILPIHGYRKIKGIKTETAKQLSQSWNRYKNLKEARSIFSYSANQFYCSLYQTERFQNFCKIFQFEKDQVLEALNDIKGGYKFGNNNQPQALRPQFFIIGQQNQLKLNDQYYQNPFNLDDSRIGKIFLKFADLKQFKIDPSKDSIDQVLIYLGYLKGSPKSLYSIPTQINNRQWRCLLHYDILYFLKSNPLQCLIQKFYSEKFFVFYKDILDVYWIFQFAKNLGNSISKPFPRFEFGICYEVEEHIMIVLSKNKCLFGTTVDTNQEFIQTYNCQVKKLLHEQFQEGMEIINYQIQLEKNNDANAVAKEDGQDDDEIFQYEKIQGWKDQYQAPVLYSVMQKYNFKRFNGHNFDILGQNFIMQLNFQRNIPNYVIKKYESVEIFKPEANN